VEPHVAIGEWKNQPPPLVSLEEYYAHAHRMCEDKYSKMLDYYRRLKLDHVTPETFWWEYVWCVYASGFNAKVLTKLFPDLQDALGMWYLLSMEDRWYHVAPLFSNVRKYNACRKTAQLLASYDSWDLFKQDHLQNTESMRKLAYIGSITCYHLARNLGMDAVKPDLHLVRLADHFGWPDPETMCHYLSGLYEERLGVVDLILWIAASTWGTLEIRNGR